MGRQINFYMEEELQKKFIQKIFEQEFIIISEDLVNKKLITFKRVEEVDSKIYYMYLYKKDYGQIITQKEFDYRLCDLFSPVVEFSKTIVNNEEKRMSRGRIWMESKYFDENNEIVNKDPRLTKDYNALVRWIKKHVPYQEVSVEESIYKEYITNNMKELADSGFRLM